MSKFKTLVGQSAAGALVIDAATEDLIVDVRDMVNVTLYVIQSTDAGTVTLPVEVSPDGTTWAAHGSALTEASFPAGNGTSVAVSLSDANGMPLVVAQARIRASALGSGGVYALKACGIQRDGHR